MSENKTMSFGFVHLTDAMFEAEPKGKLTKLIRRMINKITNNHTDIIYRTSNFYIPENLSRDELCILLSYFLEEHLNNIKEQQLNKDEIIQANIVFAQEKMPKELQNLGFKIAPIDEHREDFFFVEKGSYKNPKYDDNFNSWFKSKTSLAEINAILFKLDKEQESQKAL